MRWLRKGLPAVRAADGSVPRGGDPEADEADDEEIERQEKMDEDVAMEEMGQGVKPPTGKADGGSAAGIPPLDEEQEYEWKWKVCSEQSDKLTRLAEDGSISADILLVVCLETAVCMLLTFN